MAVIGDAYIDVKAKTDSFESDASSQLGGAMKKVVASIGAAVAVDKILDFGKGAFDAAIESQKIGAQTAQVIKTTGEAAGISAKQVGDLATAISNKTGIDDEAIQSGQNLLLTFTNVQNKAGQGNDIFNQASKIMVDMSKALGTDASGSAIQLGKALNDPIKGVTALTRVGVTFSDEQKELIKSLVSTGDTLGAQKVILGELNKEFGGSAEAQATATDKMKVAFGNLQEQIGAKLIPVVEKVATFTVTTGIPAFTRFAGNVQDVVGPVFTRFIGIVQDVFIPGFMRFVGVVQDTVIPALTRFAGFIGSVVVKAIQALAPIFDEVVDGIQGFVAAFKRGGDDVTSSGFVGVLEKLGLAARDTFDWLVKNVPPILDTIAKGFGTVVDLAEKIAENVGPAIEKAFGFLIDHKEILIGAVAGVVAGVIALAVASAAATPEVAALAAAETVALGPILAVGAAVAVLVAGVIYAYQNFAVFRDTVDATASWLRDNVPPILEEIGRIFVDVFGAAVSAVETAMGVIQTVIETVLGVVLGFWNTFGDEISNIVSAVFEYIRTTIESVMLVIQGIINVVMGLIHGDFSQVWEGIKQIFDGALTYLQGAVKLAMDLIKNLIDIAMTAIAGVFDAAWEGMKKVASAALDVLVDFFQKLPGRILAALGDLLGLLYNAGKDIVQGLWNGVKWVADQVIQYFVDLPGNLLEALRRLGALERRLFQAGIDLLDGMWDGMKDLWTKLSGWVIDIPNKLLGYLGDLGHLLTGVGEAVVQGMWNGIKNIWDRMTGWIGDAASHLPGFLKGPLGINSPSTEMYAVGVNIVDGLAAGIQSQWPTVQGILVEAATAISVPFEQVNLTGLGQSITSGLANGIQAGMGEVAVVLSNGMAYTQAQLDRWKQMGVEFTIPPNSNTHPGDTIVGPPILDPNIYPNQYNGGAIIPAFAAGGLANGLAIVGEKGPELAKFGGSTAVFPTDQLYKALWRMGQGQGTVVNINVMIDAVSAGNAHDVGRRVAEKTAQTLQAMGIGVGARQAAGR